MSEVYVISLITQSLTHGDQNTNRVTLNVESLCINEYFTRKCCAIL